MSSIDSIIDKIIEDTPVGEVCFINLAILDIEIEYKIKGGICTNEIYS